MVQKLIAIFFISVFALSTTAAGQLLKIPKLVFHYTVHKKHNGISFINFLNKHYLASDSDDGDEDEDAQLPFKDINAECFSLVYVAPIDPNVNNQFTRNNVSLQSYQPPFIDNNRVFGIFRPPRHC